jgi:uncharacterized protein YecT (DUF1311 family)
MRRAALLVAAVLACIWPRPAPATQSQAELVWIVETIVRLCLIGGDRFVLRGQGSGQQEIELNSVNAAGQLQGQFNVERTRVEGLVNGIDNSLSNVAAQQASEARRCMAPLRERLLATLMPSSATNQVGPSAAPVGAGPPAGPFQSVPPSPPAVAAGPPPQAQTSREMGTPAAFTYRPGQVNQNARGFDCAKAAMPMDYVICAFQEVYDVNTQHAVAWWATLERLSRPQRDALVQSQREWISNMLSQCGLPNRGRPTPAQAMTAAPCVRDAYVERLRYVRAYRA